jgi:hypothetical protein
MRTTALLLQFGLAAAAAAQIVPPSWGVVQHAGNQAVEIQGLPGSWLAVPTSLGPVDAVASSPSQICWTRDGTLTILDRLTSATRTIPVPAGPARFAFDSQGALAAVWFSAPGQLYTADAGWAPVVALPPAASQLLDLASPAAGLVELLLRPAATGRPAAAPAVADRPRGRIAVPLRPSAVPALRLWVIQTRTGRTWTESALADRSGPAALDSNGDVVFAADSGLPTVDSIQHLDHGWLLLTAASHQWAWRPGMRPQGTGDTSSAALTVNQGPVNAPDVGNTINFDPSSPNGLGTPLGGTLPLVFNVVNTYTSPSAGSGAGVCITTLRLDDIDSFQIVNTIGPPYGLANGQAFAMEIQFVPIALGVATANLDIEGYSYDATTIPDQCLAPLPANATVTPFPARTIVLQGTGIAPAAGPWLGSFSPLSNVVGAPSFTLTVIGANFEPSSQVLWEIENSDGTNTDLPLATTYVNPQQLTAAVPSNYLNAAGAVTIKVSNPANSAYPGVTTATANSTFTITCPTPPSLQPTLSLDQTNPVSNTSVKVTVNFLNQTAPVCTQPGLLTLTFTPAPNLADDPSIFLDGNLQETRAQPFTVPAGGNVAAFGTQDFVMLDTGTTAGTFTLLAAIGSNSATWSYVIAPAAPVISSSTLGVATNEPDLELTLVGFDNSQATSGLTFEFYTTDGSVVSPGLISLNSTDPTSVLDATSDFSTYYKANTPLAGKFQVTATFPVSGDITQILKAVVTLSNPSGTTTTTVQVQ